MATTSGASIVLNPILAMRAAQTRAGGCRPRSCHYGGAESGVVPAFSAPLPIARSGLYASRPAGLVRKVATWKWPNRILTAAVPGPILQLVLEVKLMTVRAVKHGQAYTDNHTDRANWQHSTTP